MSDYVLAFEYLVLLVSREIQFFTDLQNSLSKKIISCPNLPKRTRHQG